MSGGQENVSNGRNSCLINWKIMQNGRKLCQMTQNIAKHIRKSCQMAEIRAKWQEIVPITAEDRA